MSIESDLRDLLCVATVSDGIFCLKFDALVAESDPRKRMQTIMHLLKESAGRSPAVFDAIKAGSSGRQALAQLWAEMNEVNYPAAEPLIKVNGPKP